MSPTPGEPGSRGADRPVAAPTGIPLRDPVRENAALDGELRAAVRRVLGHGRFILGPEVQRFESALARFCGVPHCVGVGSGSDALFLALHAVGVRPGDEVVTVSYTAPMTLAAIARTGALPVFVDVRLGSGLVDPERVEQALSARTRAIVPVHLYGQCADMGALGEVARRRAVPIVEDAAQAVGAEHDGRRAGTFGSAAAFSFYPTKNLGGVGDGGAVVTADAELAERVRILRGYGQAGGVIGGAAGLNSRLDALQAAVLSVKLAHLDGWLERRRSIAERYSGVLAPLGLETPIVEPGNRHGFHLYTLCVDEREAFRARLAAEGVETAIHYPIPAHRHGAFAHGRLPAGGLPVTDRLAGRVVSLPIWPQLTEAEVERVIEAAAGSASR